MNKQQSSTKIDSNDTPTRSNPTSLSLMIEPFYIVTPGATYGLSGKLTDLRHGRPMRSQRIIFENGEGIPPINSTTTDDSGNFRVSGLRAPTTEGDYNLRARFEGRGGYEPSASHVITLSLSLMFYIRKREYCGTHYHVKFVLHSSGPIESSVQNLNYLKISSQPTSSTLRYQMRDLYKRRKRLAGWIKRVNEDDVVVDEQEIEQIS